jgi:phosphoribosylformylglycinamidine synthase
MKAKVFISLKNGVLDPQGRATLGALENLGFSGVEEVRIGKMIEIELKEKDRKKAEKSLNEMCSKLLANMVVENYKIEFSDQSSKALS